MTTTPVGPAIPSDSSKFVEGELYYSFSHVRRREGTAVVVSMWRYKGYLHSSCSSGPSDNECFYYQFELVVPDVQGGVVAVDSSLYLGSPYLIPTRRAAERMKLTKAQLLTGLMAEHVSANIEYRKSVPAPFVHYSDIREFVPAGEEQGAPFPTKRGKTKGVIARGVASLEALGQLREMPMLEVLSLSDSPASPHELEVVLELEELKDLTLAHTSIDDELLKSILRLPRLRRLNVSNTCVTDSALMEMNRPSRLEILRVDDTGVTGEGVARCLRCVSLKQLSAVGLKVGGMLTSLARDTELTELNLAHSDLDDSDIESIAELANLSELHIDSTNVGDAGLCRLQGHPSLRRINFRNTSISSQAVVRFHDRQPECFLWA